MINALTNLGSSVESVDDHRFRHPQDLSKLEDYLQPMIKAKKLRYKYPTIPNHPEQAYLTEASSV